MADGVEAAPDAMEVDSLADENTQSNSSSKGSKRILLFRNYLPHDENLRQKKRPPPPDLLKSLEESFKKQASINNDESLLTLGPQNPNWDLKRDIQAKLDKLDALTNRALAELLQDKRMQ